MRSGRGHYLRNSGFRLGQLSEVNELLQHSVLEDPAVVLLDARFARGIEAIKRLREISDVAIVIIGLDDEFARDGLEAGANQVLVEPFSSRLLVANLEAAVRNRAPNMTKVSEVSYSQGDLSVDFVDRVVTA